MFARAIGDRAIGPDAAEAFFGNIVKAQYLALGKQWPASSLCDRMVELASSSDEATLSNSGTP